MPTLRWYRSTAPAIVVGRAQRVDAAQADGPVLVARHSGGGAVLMDAGLLSLDVLLPAGDPLLAGDVGAVFVRVGAAWAAALTGLGVPAVRVHDGPSTAHRLGDERQRLLASVCYATLGRGEVLAGGRKLVGLAQRRRRPGALVQCGLLRRWRPKPLLAGLGFPPDDAEVAAHAVGLDELVDPPLPDGTVQAAVEAAMQAMATQEPT
ncbi:hypothetical protein BH20ACT9_BH20ACT9_09930 [soil metagenome]